MPTSLNNRIFIARHEWHRVIKGTGKLLLKIYKSVKKERNIVLEDKTSRQYKELVNAIKDKYGAKYLGSGDNGVALELPNGKVIKVTTDSVELEHAETLKNTNFTSIIPIEKVKIIKDNLGYIVMMNATKLTSTERISIEDAEKDVEAYLFNNDLEALRRLEVNTKLHNFVVSIKDAYEKTGLDIEEIDYSADNIMNYDGRFVMVDL